MEGGGFNKAGSSPDAAGGAGEGASRRAPAAYYECGFCKRGFTNAQALGGHMNIHRKDRGGAGKSRGGDPDPPPAPGPGAGGSQVHLGLTLGRDEREGVDLELRLGHYPYN